MSVIFAPVDIVLGVSGQARLTSMSAGAGFDPRVPFTPQQARKHGIDRGALLGPDFHRIMHGIYVSSAVPITFELTARAVLDLMDDDAHLSHFSAARFWKLWVPRDPRLHVCRVGDRRHSRAGVTTHVCTRHGAAREPGDVFIRKGIAVTSPVGCFFELAAALPFVDLVILGDSLARQRRIRPEDLVTRALSYCGPGARRAREAARLVRAGVDSQMETRLRLLVVFAGLPEPRVNLKLRDEDGNVRRRIELVYEEFDLALEYDGEQHRETSDAWNDDIIRRDELASAGLRSVVVTKRGIFREPLVTVERVERALRDAGWTSDRRPRRDWRSHFPGY
jgi:hypothetical protein